MPQHPQQGPGGHRPPAQPAAGADQTAAHPRSQEQQAARAPGGYAPQPAYGPPQQQQPGYGGPHQQRYQGGNANPSGAWPMTTPDSKASFKKSGGAGALVALAVAALAAAVYAGWAFTARRGIFADFADGSAVSTDDAKSSDRIDTALLIVAGVLVLVALGWWIARLVARKTKGGGLDVSGLVVAVLGVVAVLVGLYLASVIADADGQAAQGDEGVTATLVVGGGFVLLAIGLLIGTSTVRSSAAGSSGSNDHPGGPGYQNW